MDIATRGERPVRYEPAETQGHGTSGAPIGRLSARLWRGGASDGPGGGAFETYDVPLYPSQTVLDVVAWVQQNADPTLTYRYACRVGMCGSCAMWVNGEPRWTCRTHVAKVAGIDAEGRGAITVEPLRNLPVIKDLATDMDPFFDRWVAAEAVHHPSATRHDATVPVDPASDPRRAADEGIECINCAICYAACDAVAANPDYLGPAALNRAWTLVNDARDGAREAILDAVSAPGGCHACHSQGSCVEYCPAGLNPTASIAALRRETGRRSLRRFFGRGR